MIIFVILLFLDFNQNRLDNVYDQTQSLGVAQKSLDSYNNVYQTSVVSITARREFDPAAHTCWNCSSPYHPWPKCPAKDAECFKCGHKKPFSKVCCSKTSNKQTSTAMFPTLTWLDGPSSKSFNKYVVPVYRNNRKFRALIDSGSTDNFIHQRVIDQLSLNLTSCDSILSMASTAHVKFISEYVKFQDKMYDSMKLTVLDDSCVDIIFVSNFQT